MNPKFWLYQPILGAVRACLKASQCDISLANMLYNSTSARARRLIYMFGTMLCQIIWAVSYSFADFFPRKHPKPFRAKSDLSGMIHSFTFTFYKWLKVLMEINGEGFYNVGLSFHSECAAHLRTRGWKRTLCHFNAFRCRATYRWLTPLRPFERL